MKYLASITLILFATSTIPAYGHGGGLNRDGCHRETATGGYHCHRGSSSGDPDWETVLIVLGGVAVGLLVLRWLSPKRNTLTMTDLAPTPEERPWRLHYTLGESEAPTVGLSWRIAF